MADLVTRLLLQTNNFDDGITKSAAEIRAMRATAENANKSFNLVKGTIGKFASVLGIAMTAGEALNRAINGCRASTDAFGKMQEMATTSVDNFFTSIASGDFSTFLNGMDSIAEKAREAYEAMESLYNLSQSYRVKSAQETETFDKNLIIIRKGKKGQVSKAEANKAAEENNRIIAGQISDALTMKRATVGAVLKKVASHVQISASDLSEEGIGRISRGYLEKVKVGNRTVTRADVYQAQYNSYLSQLHKIENSKTSYSMFGGGSNWIERKINPIGNMTKTAKQKVRALNKKYAETIAGYYYLFKQSKDDLNTSNEQIVQASEYGKEAYAKQSQMIRYGENSVIKGKGVGKHTPTRTNVPEVPKTEMQKLEDQLQSLEAKTPTILDAEKLKSVYAEIDAIVKRMTDLQNSQSENSLNARFSLFNTYGIRNRANPTYNNGNASNRLIGSGGQSAAWDQLQGTAPNMDLIDKEVRGMSAPVDTTNQKLTDTYNTMSTIYNVSGQLAGSFSDLGAAFKELGADSKGFSAALAVAQFAMAISSAIGGMVDKANKSSLTVWDWIAGIAAGTAAVVTMAAQIKSIGAFANGGIVQGSSYSGDKLMVRANSGEMILNGGQQKNLFDLINNGGTAGGGRVEFMISGSNLKGVLNNYDHKTSKI